jgi:hypothetical protein
MSFLGTEENDQRSRSRVWLMLSWGSALTEIEFALRTARALASTFPDKATNFVVNALRQTVDPRLRHLLEPALAAFGHNEVIAACKWLDRACEYERARRESIKTTDVD